jgi:hypothetical protein
MDQNWSKMDQKGSKMTKIGQKRSKIGVHTIIFDPKMVQTDHFL